MTGKYVLVTTAHRGVFAGVLKALSDDEKRCDLAEARCAIRFGTTEGFLELAESGPTKDSRIGSTAPEIRLYDLTSITVCSSEAEKAWRDA